ncbi:hypothetical protein DFP73DRAFT_238551 [Morchella snyderi]|nr:hypothetical protein DFP73DRAFT_238551 [Morchella snyderi]
MMAKQGEIISVFTLITAMSLPLNFMATFFGMNPPNWKGIASTAWQFWAIRGAITLIVTVVMGVFLFHGDSRMKDRLRNWLQIGPGGTRMKAVIMRARGRVQRAGMPRL